MKKKGGKRPPSRKLAMDDEYLIQPNTLYCTFEYKGPYRLIYSKIGYQWPERGSYREHSDFTEGYC